MKRVMIDMSTTLLHQGHIRLLKKAKQMGYVIVALTTDDEVFKHKGYEPELTYEERQEMLLALKYVDEVVPSPWLLTEDYVKQHNADVLIHAGPNANEVDNVVIFDRTEGISTTDLRERALAAIVQKRNSERPVLTPGPCNLHPENLLDLNPGFSRDPEYQSMEKAVLERIGRLAGKEQVVTLQGSATTAIEVATTNFLSGNVVAITSGYYSQRIVDLIERKKDSLRLESFKTISYEAIQEVGAPTDWIVAVYTETADAFLLDILKLKEMAQRCGAKLMIDATGSINLEQHHDVADVLMFSSCKGLGGLTGAGFIAFDQTMLNYINSGRKEFILDLDTYISKKTTSPVHAISSLKSVSLRFEELSNRVKESKQRFVSMFEERLHRKTNQPQLCTKINGRMNLPESALVYEPRTINTGEQVICHLFDQYPSNRAIGELYEAIQILD
jgi:cytidyltransferase-like protein